MSTLFLSYGDLFLTPLYLLLLYGLAYAVRAKVTNTFTRPYFIPALTVKFIGAIALGLIYEFYYHGGDTSGYYSESRRVYGIFGTDFSGGWTLLWSNIGEINSATAKYAGLFTWFSHAPSEDFIVRICVVLSFLCFNTYMPMALLFAVASFSGIWAMLVTFLKIRPGIYKQLAPVVLFIPSVFFWGSGLGKDSLCLGALGWVFYAFYRGTIEKKNILRCLIIGGIAATVLIKLKVYILLSFLPPATLWVFNENSSRIRSSTVRLLAKPILLLVGGALAYTVGTRLTAGDGRFALDKIGERSKITAEYLYITSKTQDGSAYYIGSLDGSLGSMAKLAPQAIIVSLFRPFIWEARNPIMMLSALEALAFLLFTLRIFYRAGIIRTLTRISTTPVLSMCFIFALVFAASVGINSGNFGTLVRYKIPLIPFYACGLLITQDLGQSSPRKRPQLAQARPVPA